jgi:hypothetical protein
MQAWTMVLSHTAPTASGRPVSPSQACMHTDRVLDKGPDLNSYLLGEEPHR